MVLVTVYQGKNGKYAGFSTEGHADYAKSGKDIVCASVSVLIINTINSIETFCREDYISCRNEEKSGHIELKLNENHSSETGVLMDSMVLGLKQISKTYGGRYLKVNIKEV